jgi:hypothetical protein
MGNAAGRRCRGATAVQHRGGRHAGSFLTVLWKKDEGDSRIDIASRHVFGLRRAIRLRMARLTWVRGLLLIAGAGITFAAEDIRIPLLNATLTGDSHSLAGSYSSPFVPDSSYPVSEPVRSALPEPATIMLFGTVAWFVGAKLRRNGRQRPAASLHGSPVPGEQADNGRRPRGISLHDRPGEHTDGSGRLTRAVQAGR